MAKNDAIFKLFAGVISFICVIVVMVVAVITDDVWLGAGDIFVVGVVVGWYLRRGYLQCLRSQRTYHAGMSDYYKQMEQ